MIAVPNATRRGNGLWPRSCLRAGNARGSRCSAGVTDLQAMQTCRTSFHNPARHNPTWVMEMGQGDCSCNRTTWLKGQQYSCRHHSFTPTHPGRQPCSYNQLVCEHPGWDTLLRLGHYRGAGRRRCLQSEASSGGWILCSLHNFLRACQRTASRPCHGVCFQQASSLPMQTHLRSPGWLATLSTSVSVSAPP